MDSVTRALETEDVEAHQKWVRSLARSPWIEWEADDGPKDARAGNRLLGRPAS